MAANVPPFALAPALAGANHPIDYSTRAGQALYKQAIETLPYVFEGKTSSLPAFLQAVRDRSDTAGWDDIFTIITGQDANGANIERNLLTQYGEITLDNVRANATADYIGQPNRNAQISHQIYQCLRKSISTNVNDRLVTESDNFYVLDTPDGPAFLMTIINVYFVKTNATPTTLRLKIADAHLLVAEHEYDIDAFNTELNSYIQKLASNGAHTEDLFAHLTKAYRAVPDKEFQRYIRERIDAHNDGTAILTENELMERAKAKYDALVEANSWMVKDETEQQLVTLTAQLQLVQEDNKALKRKVQQGSSATTKTKKSSKDTDDKWAWKDKQPKSNQPTKKTFEGKTYHWCPNHKKWTIHTPEECRLKDQPQPAADPVTSAGSADPASLSAILNANDDEETDGNFSDE